MHRLLDGLRTQLEAYWRDEWPFNQPVKDNDPLSWWKTLAEHPYARVLAVHVKLFCFCLFHLSTNQFGLLNTVQYFAIKIFSVLVNSMPDERTNLTITWFNSPIRGSQNAQTLVDMIQIGQWYGKHQVCALWQFSKHSVKFKTYSFYRTMIWA